jgi:hypothetical protein
LNQVAEGGIQPAVVRASMQFGVQLAGLGVAAFAERVGPADSVRTGGGVNVGVRRADSGSTR